MNVKKLSAKREKLVLKMEAFVEQRAESMDNDALKEIKDMKNKVDALDMLIANGLKSDSETRIADNASDEEFRSFLRGETRAIAGNSNLSVADGKAVNPDDFSQKLFTEMTKSNGILTVAQMFATSSNVLKYPYSNDTTTDAAKQTELDDVESHKLVMAELAITINTIARQITVSNQLVNDNQVDLPSVIARLLGESFLRTASADAFVALLAKITPTAAAAIAYDVLVDMFTSVESGYLNNASWVMSRVSFGKVMKLTDTTKQPVVQTHMGEEVNFSIMGKPVLIDDSAGADIWFGDFSTLIFAHNGETTLMVDPYSASSQLATKYIGDLRAGFGALSDKAIVAQTLS